MAFPTQITDSTACLKQALERVFVAVAGADANDLLDGADEDFAVADLAGASRVGNGVNDFINLRVFDGDFDFDLRQKVDGVFGATVAFDVTLLAATTANVGNGHTHDADIGEGTFDILQLMGAYYGFYEFHIR